MSKTPTIPTQPATEQEIIKAKEAAEQAEKEKKSKELKDGIEKLQALENEIVTLAAKTHGTLENLKKLHVQESTATKVMTSDEQLAEAEKEIAELNAKAKQVMELTEPKKEKTNDPKPGPTK